MRAGSERPARWIGLDIGASKILAALVDDRGAPVASFETATLRDEGPERVLARAADAARRVGSDGVRGLGAGIAGLVDRVGGAVRSSVMLPGWRGVPAAARLSAALGLPCVVDNDATAAGYGEFVALGSPKGLNMVVLTVGTGIGGAIIVDGALYRGSGGFAGEFGNMSIDWRGADCWCDAKGCLNILASGSAIASAAGLSAGSDGVRSVAAAARGGDAAARAALADGARALGAGIANIVNILNPDRVALAGGVPLLGEEYVAAVRDEARRRAFPEAFDQCRIEAATLGAAAGAIGAACLARDAAGPGRAR